MQSENKYEQRAFHNQGICTGSQKILLQDCFQKLPELVERAWNSFEKAQTSNLAVDFRSFLEPAICRASRVTRYAYFRVPRASSMTTKPKPFNCKPADDGGLVSDQEYECWPAFNATAEIIRFCRAASEISCSTLAPLSSLCACRCPSTKFWQLRSQLAVAELLMLLSCWHL